MSLSQQVYAQAENLVGVQQGQGLALLTVLCGSAVSNLTQRLKDGVYAEDCQEAFVMAAAFLAAAAFGRAWQTADIQEFKAGDLTVKQGSGDSTARGAVLEEQAKALMKPYLKDGFQFTGV